MPMKKIKSAQDVHIDLPKQVEESKMDKLLVIIDVESRMIVGYKPSN
jgi:hypothetical protein